MRILTVRQPWAWAIIHGGKTVENRVRNIAGDYRGPVLIHAAKANDVDAWSAMGRMNIAAYLRALDVRESLIGGAIIGVVDLVDSHPVETCITQQYDGDWLVCSEWAERAGHHMVLANPRSLDEPLPYTGALGLRKTEFAIVNDYLVAPWGHGPGSCTPYGCEPWCAFEPVARLVTP